MDKEELHLYISIVLYSYLNIFAVIKQTSKILANEL